MAMRCISTCDKEVSHLYIVRGASMSCPVKANTPYDKWNDQMHMPSLQVEATLRQIRKHTIPFPQSHQVKLPMFVFNK